MFKAWDKYVDNSSISRVQVVGFADKSTAVMNSGVVVLAVVQILCAIKPQVFGIYGQAFLIISPLFMVFLYTLSTGPITTTKLI